ncbi:FeoA family protein [Planctomycetota bacterium]|nr:FeoA family protein [Planctomycetota bacterium]
MLTKTQPPAPLAIFSQFDGELEVVEVMDDSDDAKRMCELGFCPGKTVTIIAQGDPAIVNIAGTRLAVGLDLLSRIFVRPRG